ncbi:DUF3081 domain-containing protein [Aliiglaciecola sp. M165]|uniref:DUF3081 domain-containing protein n=1 Tax=Aliiglaciecola sp. M165 TaxID=2593649 RepID=UPI00117F2DCC|nr:DUF3081 domain-containing protein [Aliiglaciecola sp. M165]TRY30841.1 DUF3081 domain-containing protein [Aliiglaciecola sp. M165]
MKNELDSRFILSVFEKIKEHGEVVEGGHMLENIKAYTDHDGYTLYLEDNQVTLRFGFHNQYHFDYEKADHLEQFERRLKLIEKMDF